MELCDWRPATVPEVDENWQRVRLAGVDERLGLGVATVHAMLGLAASIALAATFLCLAVLWRAPALLAGVVLWTIVGLVLYRAPRRGVYLSAAGVQVRNLVRTYHFTWSGLRFEFVSEDASHRGEQIDAARELPVWQMSRGGAGFIERLCCSMLGLRSVPC
jgi:hypothetical protein